MKKIIAAIIRFVIPNVIRQHEKEVKTKRAYNATIMQQLLDAEHDLRDKVNEKQFIPSTTKKAISMANKYGFSKYNSVRALNEARFK